LGGEKDWPKHQKQNKDRNKAKTSTVHYFSFLIFIKKYLRLFLALSKSWLFLGLL